MLQTSSLIWKSMTADRQTDRQYGAGMLEAAVWILQELRCEVRLKACMASLGDASRSEM